MYTKLYESGLINEEFGFDNMVEEKFSCAAICGESSDPKLVQKEIYKEIERVYSEGFDLDSFERIKKAYLGSFLRGFNDVEQIAGSVLRNFLGGVNIFNFTKVHSQADIEYITEVFKQVFKKETMVISIVWPVE